MSLLREREKKQLLVKKAEPLYLDGRVCLYVCMCVWCVCVCICVCVW